MGRRKQLLKPRNIVADVVYGSTEISKFINYIMKCGKKATAARLVYLAMDQLKEKLGTDPVTALRNAIEILRPKKEVKVVRIGGHNIQVPAEISEARSSYLAFQMLIKGMEQRSENLAQDRIAGEIFDILENKGNAVKRKVEMDKNIEANAAFVGHNKR